MKYRLILLALCFHFVVSCHHYEKSADADFSNVTRIFYDSVSTKRVCLDDIIDSVYFVRLETNSKCMIGEINQVMIDDSSIIVVDSYIAKAIYVFDREGHFKNTISRIGNASNEYLMLSYVYINASGEVCIMDNAKQRIAVFSKDGRYLYSNDIPYLNVGVENINGDTLAIFVFDAATLNNDRQVERACYVVVDRKFRPVYTFGKDPSVANPDFHLQRDQTLYKFGNDLYCTLNYGNTIYQMGTEGVKAKYELDVSPGELYYPKEEDFASSDVMIEAKKDYVTFTGSFIECKDYSFFEYRFPNVKRRYHYVLYNHLKDSVIALEPYVMDPVLAFFRNPLTRSGDNTIICVKSASDVLYLKDVLLSVDHSSMVDSLYSGMAIDSNPVLFFFDIDINK